jgi:hypothetical protein
MRYAEGGILFLLMQQPQSPYAGRQIVYQAALLLFVFNPLAGTILFAANAYDEYKDKKGKSK